MVARPAPDLPIMRPAIRVCVAESVVRTVDAELQIARACVRTHSQLRIATVRTSPQAEKSSRTSHSKIRHLPESWLVTITLIAQ